jgi:hypothetical protein
MAEAFAESFARSRTLLRAASQAGHTYFRHMPWLCPGVTAFEVSLWDMGESPVFAGGTLVSGDRILLYGSFESGRLRYWLSVIPVSGRAGSVMRQGRPRGFHAKRDGYSGVGRILAQAARSGGTAVGWFSRTL